MPTPIESFHPGGIGMGVKLVGVAINACVVEPVYAYPDISPLLLMS
jgi:hypothetical protein